MDENKSLLNEINSHNRSHLHDSTHLIPTDQYRDRQQVAKIVGAWNVYWPVSGYGINFGSGENTSVKEMIQHTHCECTKMLLSCMFKNHYTFNKISHLSNSHL